MAEDLANQPVDVPHRNLHIRHTIRSPLARRPHTEAHSTRTDGPNTLHRSRSHSLG